MSVTVTFRRLAGRRRNIASVGVAIVSEVQDAMNAQILTAVDIMRSEPPPKAGSKYIRTHTYANSWRPIFARASGGRLEGGISGNAVDPSGTNYTERVGGDKHGEGQIQMHADTRWPLAVDALEGRTTGVMLTPVKPQLFRNRVRKAVRKAIRDAR
jgi:hypothetical protein